MNRKSNSFIELSRRIKAEEKCRAFESEHGITIPEWEKQHTHLDVSSRKKELGRLLKASLDKRTSAMLDCWNGKFLQLQ